MNGPDVEVLEPAANAEIPSPKPKIDGVVIGILAGFRDNGTPLVAFPGNPVDEFLESRTTVNLEHDAVGCSIALLFEAGDPERPLIIGRIQNPPNIPNTPQPQRSATVTLDGQQMVLSAEHEIVLRCGKSSITLTREGKILLRGTYLLSRSSGVNRIKGGSVQIN